MNSYLDHLLDQLMTAEPREDWKDVIQRSRRSRRRYIVVFAVVAALLLAPAAWAISDALQPGPTPSQMAANLLTEWTNDISQGAATDHTQFAEAVQSDIRSTVQQNASEFDYAPVRVDVATGESGAPLVVVRYTGANLASFSQAFPALWQRLDPTAQAGGGSCNIYKYEGFFFEALDSNDVPFLIVWNALRQPTCGGGQWARADDLLPFAHG